MTTQGVSYARLRRRLLASSLRVVLILNISIVCISHYTLEDMSVIIKKVIEEEEGTKRSCIGEREAKLGVGVGGFGVGFGAFLGRGGGLAAKCDDAYFGRR